MALVYKEKYKARIFENYVLNKNKTPLLILNSKRTAFILHLADNTQVKLTVDYYNYHKKLVHT